jgi:LmbE family N-acetylglucosaminyl deacetylase
VRIGVIAAHPDDEVLGCGATMARLAVEHEVHVALLGEGFASRSVARDASVDAELRRLHEAAQQVASMLGVRSLKLASLPDNQFDRVALLDIVRWVEGWLADVRPTVVYTHHPGDLNVDHRLTFQALLTATRPVPGCGVREVYSFEAPSSTEWAFQRLEPAFRPNTFVDVTDTIEMKIKALEAYAGEARTFPHPRSPEALRAASQRWGSVAGVPNAEAFELIRAIR